jgi:hypothetical protein
VNDVRGEKYKKDRAVREVGWVHHITDAMSCWLHLPLSLSAPFFVTVEMETNTYLPSKRNPRGHRRRCVGVERGYHTQDLGTHLSFHSWCSQLKEFQNVWDSLDFSESEKPDGRTAAGNT